MSEEKKSLFDKAIDALTNRDEKEAAAELAEEKALADTAQKEADAHERMAVEEKAVVQRAAVRKAEKEKAAAIPKKGI